MSDKMREEFEAWHKSELANLIIAKEVGAARYMERLKGSLFCAWEASRAALVVELTIPDAPRDDDYEYPAQNDTFNSDYSEFVGARKQNRVIREALTKAGVTVK